METKRGWAVRSSLAPEDGRQPELTRDPCASAHRWARIVRRPAWGTPVPVFRSLAPGRRAPGTVHNSPGEKNPIVHRSKRVGKTLAQSLSMALKRLGLNLESDAITKIWAKRDQIPCSEFSSPWQ